MMQLSPWLPHAGSGVRVHLPAARLGHIGLTDLHDSFTADAVSDLAVGDFVRCKCLISSGAPGASALHASCCCLPCMSFRLRRLITHSF